MKSFEEFQKAIETDDALKAKAKEAFENAGVKTREDKISVFVKIAAESGYDVSVEDFSKQQADGQEMDEDELKMVSGGGYCLADFACETAWNTCAVSNECRGTNSCNSSVYL